MQNERLPMSIVNAKGEERLGMFTKPTYVRVKGKYLDIIEKAKAQAAALNRQKLDNYLMAFRQMNAGVTSNQRGRKLNMDSSDDIKDYYPKGNNKKASNLFRMLDEYIQPRVKYYRDADKPFVPLPDQPKPTLKEVAAADRCYTVGGLTDELGKVSRLAGKNEAKTFKEKLNKAFRGSSDLTKW